ncbi:hypothetical protein DF185_02225 [Marinifilum breve]|uniref:Uncharacterized protein n=1 Tax=Marinifilum breve TaxID=2184082 RepID=A0A2V4A2Q8_9BACT|nr:hypothetical protein [Marinifilum breve]PXY02932.1 hypothetical protein DF185_02225 [Marinifilum breve]
MNRIYCYAFTLSILMVLLSYDKKEVETELISNCEITTEYFGTFILKVFSKNEERQIKKENICWNNEYPIQIGSGGLGNCGIGYEDELNPYLSSTINISEYDISKPESNSIIRSMEIEFLSVCNDYSTQESFYNLIQNGNYKFASSRRDFGKFIVSYTAQGKTFRSVDVDNNKMQVSISDTEYIKPKFNTEPNGNNGLPASTKATLTFSCLLKNSDGEFVEIKNAKIRGKFFRQSPWGYYWDDWGKGWDE